jgi:hypothetical protein
MDLFVVPTIGFDLLYAFVIVRLDRRDLVWINVTANPTAEWVARQITEAFPWDEAPRHLIRDRDRIYGSVVTRRLRHGHHPGQTELRGRGAKAIEEEIFKRRGAVGRRTRTHRNDDDLHRHCGAFEHQQWPVRHVRVHTQRSRGDLRRAAHSA